MLFPLRRQLAARLLFVFVLLLGSPAALTSLPAYAQTNAAIVSAAAPVEDRATQLRTLGDAYNLLMDRYVHPLDSAAMAQAAWDQLTHDAAERKAPAPGDAPAFVGDRAADLEALRGGLSGYLDKGGIPTNLVPVHALIRGMVHFVDEGHTYFLDPQQYSDYQSWSRGENKYVGIGVSVSARGTEPRISEVYDGTPAAQAGLRAGDVMLQINGQPVAGRALDELTALVRGPAGTSVTMVVRRAGEPDPLTFTVQRSEISLDFVRQRLVADDVGYVLLRGFPEPSVVDAIERDITGFQAQGVRGVVLDLRGNSGGRLDVGTRLLGHFLPSGASIYEEVDRSGRSRVHYTRNDAVQYDIPLVVLVDNGTASMGEIFASAVQEHGVATVLGTSTAGSVAAAQVFPLGDGSGLQVTVFEILSSDGKRLNQVGVTPDEVVDTDATALASGDDPVLSRAVEILHTGSARGPDPGSQAQPQGS
jgi:carboxyl-terminal processing protease